MSEQRTVCEINSSLLFSFCNIFSDFLNEDATHTINVDAKTYNHVKLNLNNPSYNTFDEAQVIIENS